MAWARLAASPSALAASAAVASLIRPSASATNCSLLWASASAESAWNACLSSASRRVSSCSRCDPASRSLLQRRQGRRRLGLRAAQPFDGAFVLLHEVVEPLQQPGALGAQPCRIGPGHRGGVGRRTPGLRGRDPGRDVTRNQATPAPSTAPTITPMSSTETAAVSTAISVHRPSDGNRARRAEPLGPADDPNR